MSDDTARTNPTVSYPTDVSKAIQLLGQRKIVDADAVVNAFGEVRDDAAKKELARIVAWLKKRPCPTPASWAGTIQALEDGEYKRDEP